MSDRQWIEGEAAPASAGRRRLLRRAGCGAWLIAGGGAAFANEPIQPAWRETAQRVAARGVPESALAPNAPEFHVVRPGDTLWSIAGIFLRSPWHWPQLWGMNLQQIRNPHLIYPGQRLHLVRAGGRAWLQMGAAGGVPTVRLSPRVRSELLDNGAIASVPLRVIRPFLTDSVVLEPGALDRAPRIVATQEGRVLVAQGERAYVRGPLGGMSQFTVYRQPQPILDPGTREVLGHEARYVGQAELLRVGFEPGPGAPSDDLPVPSTIRMLSVRQEGGVGDRLAPVAPAVLDAHVPRAPQQAIAGRVASVHGEALLAGQNQIVALNRGAVDGLEIGHVLTVWRAGERAFDTTVGRRAQPIRLPDERDGTMFVFRVFDRVSYALIMTAQDPIEIGDRFSDPALV